MWRGQVCHAFVNTTGAAHSALRCLLLTPLLLPLLLLLLLQGGGGEHAGHAWTPELPNDSALLFYLFAAFVAAPGWNFPPPGTSGPDNSR